MLEIAPEHQKDLALAIGDAGRVAVKGAAVQAA